MAEADRWSVWRRGVAGSARTCWEGGQGSCVGVRESSHCFDPSDHTAPPPPTIMSDQYVSMDGESMESEHEGEENVKGISTRADTGSVNAASESAVVQPCFCGENILCSSV